MIMIDQTVKIIKNSMVDQILQFHSDLEKGQTVKIITALDNYTTYVNRTDVLKDVDGNLLILRANGARVIINPDYIVAACIIERF